MRAKRKDKEGKAAAQSDSGNHHIPEMGRIGPQTGRRVQRQGRLDSEHAVPLLVEK